jgi:hypothetical protein
MVAVVTGCNATGLKTTNQQIFVSVRPENRQIWLRSRRAKNLSAGAPQEVPLGYIWSIFRGINFENNADIGQIGHLWMGTSLIVIRLPMAAIGSANNLLACGRHARYSRCTPCPGHGPYFRDRFDF